MPGKGFDLLDKLDSRFIGGHITCENVNSTAVGEHRLNPSPETLYGGIIRDAVQGNCLTGCQGKLAGIFLVRGNGYTGGFLSTQRGFNLLKNGLRGIRQIIVNNSGYPAFVCVGQCLPALQRVRYQKYTEFLRLDGLFRGVYHVVRISNPINELDRVSDQNFFRGLAVNLGQRTVGGGRWVGGSLR